MVRTFLKKKAMQRFLKYSLVGTTTFAFDLLLLFVSIHFFHIQYLVATASSFLISVSVNYHFSRKHVFSGTSRGHVAGYSSFIVMSGVGLLIISGLMALLVGVFGWNYLVSRILIAGFVGIGNYLFSLFVTFKVAGKH